MPTPQITSEPGRPDGWSRLNVSLHWLIVVLIVAQALDNGSMTALWDASIEGKAISGTDTFIGWFHIVAGTTILVAAAIRLIDRFVVGRPPHPEPHPTWASWLAQITHVLLYAALFAMPALGLAAWFTGNDAIAGYHTFLWTPLLVLIGLHVVGALAQHFVFRTDALRRMLRFGSVSR